MKRTDETSRAHDARAPETGVARCGPILVVEDDDDTREVLRELLEEHGYVVAEARHGKEALVWLAERPPPCLILLDVMMPVMTGLEVVEALRSDPAHAATPVVLISAWPEKAAQARGVQGVMKKPFNLATLFEHVGRHC